MRRSRMPWRGARARALGAMVATVGLAGVVGCSGGTGDGQPAEVQTDAVGATSGTADGARATGEGAGPVEVIEVYDRGSGFTQGLELLDDGRLLHSTGRYGESRLEILMLGDEAAVEAAADLPADEFGEGATMVGETAYQLTWKSGVVHTWSVPGVEPGPELSIEGEGWGLCHDETRDVLWLSDGSAQLQALAADGLAPGDRVAVTDQGEPVPMLNELECVDGQVWANIWHSDDVVRIDPATGEVTARIDLSGVVEAEGATGEEDVLNGIAYDTSDGTFLITGKSWEHIYRVDLGSAVG